MLTRFQAHDRLGTLYLRIGDTEQAKVMLCHVVILTQMANAC